MSKLPADLKFAGRLLRRSPGFTLTAVTALALGIGANTAIFSVVNAVLLRPLPYPQPDRLVQLRGKTPGGDYNPTSIPRFMAYRALTGVFQDVTAYDWNGGAGVNLGSGGEVEQVRGEHVSQAYFHLFGARMILGRPFVEAEDRPGGSRVVVLSGGLWQRRFAGDRHMVGRTILLGGDPYAVVGVADPAFAPDPPADLWLPLQADPDTASHAFFVYCAARLRPGVTLQQAQAALGVAAAVFRRKYPAAISPKSSFTAQPLRDNLTGEIRPALLVLLAAVACVLLIACANVTGLLLARGTGRSREMAIRAALGATRPRIVRQLLAESLLLAAMGGVLGLLLGAVGVRALLAAGPGNIPRIAGAVLVDAHVLAFTLLVTLATGIAFGLAPALQVSRTDLIGNIKRSHRARGALVIAEVAVAVILLTGAGLLLRSFDALHRMAPGFDGRNVLTLETSLQGSRFESARAVIDMVHRGEERIREIPGVRAVTVAPSVPLESSFGMTYNIDGRPAGPALYHGGASWRSVSPDYFEVFRIPILSGRGFTGSDNAASPLVVVISQSLARRQWPHEDPIGRTISIFGGGDNLNALHCRIVGIAGDVHQDGLHEEAGATLYVPLAQVGDALMAMVRRVTPLAWAVRARSAPMALAPAVTSEIRRAAGLPVANLRVMEQVAAQSLACDRFNTLLMTSFAMTAILLAAIGLYGLISFTMQQRTLEFGIRLAVGADGPQLRNLILRQAMTLAAAGLASGLAAAFALTRLMSALLFGVQPHDPLVFLTVPLLLGAVSLAASYLPARRAVHLQPLTALRHE
ncbi:MAG: ABC transporter permease [Candidatus Sulfopaludibacter sp.]|nr:ABC transporter permease [Candidatus Sulfopaludibacter sp.]